MLKTLTFEEKRRLIKAVDEDVKKKSDIAKEFSIPPNTLSTIFKNRGKYEDEDMLCKMKRCKKAKFVNVDECLKMVKTVPRQECSYIRIHSKRNFSDEKALQFAQSLGHKDFVLAMAG
ncbi:MAG: hypothetical protein ACEY3E_07845 [Candidatus Tisiphia sp.]